jgi:thioredoxin reductase
VTRTPVAVVGAGPYGLGVSAHLSGRGVEHRVFGHPMSSWTEHMAEGGFLKSEAFASSIGDPGDTATLERYLREEGLPYRPVGVPVSRDLFAAYGRWFQRRLVPHLEETDVVRIEPARRGFALGLADGDSLEADAVVVAVGLLRGAGIPDELAGLGDRVSHSVDHSAMKAFAGRDVAVVGGGQSALECSTLLAESGARPTLLVREGRISWAGTPSAERSLVEALRRPQTPLGPDLKLWLYGRAMTQYRRLPEGFRTDRGWWLPAGPEGAWWLRERFERAVTPLLSHRVVASRLDAGRAVLDVSTPDGPRSLPVDHVLAATGYRYAVDALEFLDKALRARVGRLGGGPRLSTTFMSSVPGLYFAGAAATGDFGPAMRFVCGTGFAGARIARALA